jgi:transposase
MRITKQKQNELVLQIGLDLLNGDSPDQVAEKYDISKMTVYSYIRKESLLNKAKLIGELMTLVTDDLVKEEISYLNEMKEHTATKIRNKFDDTQPQQSPDETFVE